MDGITREKLLKVALVAFGAIFFTIYPLSLIWPSGWQWHSGHGQYYFQMICGIYAVLGAFLIAAAHNPFRTSEPNLLHGLVERGARWHHGSAGYT
jgi:hypothetical protein